MKPAIMSSSISPNKHHWGSTCISKIRRYSYIIVCVLFMFALLDSAVKDGSFRVMVQQKKRSITEHHKFPYYHQAVLVKSNGSAFENETSVYLERMIHDKRLVRSAQHQSKFFARRKEINHDVLSNFPVGTLFQTFTSAWSAIPLNKDWGYVHIWKAGGTTMQKQANLEDNNDKRADQVSIETLQKTHKQWFTFVRDPLDHFLSGYSECGFRSSRNIKVSELAAWNESDYDRRILAWLNTVKQSSGWLPCELHSYPQVNSLLNSMGQFHPQLKAIGDVQEMPAFLDRITSFAYNHNKTAGNDATTNHIKVNYFPARKDLLSDETLQKICEYISLDYYFFDYDPPMACTREDMLKDDGYILLTPQAQPEGQLQRLQQNQKEDERKRKADQQVKLKFELDAQRQKKLQKRQEQLKQKQQQLVVQATTAQTETAK